MTKYKIGDIECGVVVRSDGRFQGRVTVAPSVLDNRDADDYICPEIDGTREDALRRAMNYTSERFPPE